MTHSAPLALDAIWSWFGSRRLGKRYQPVRGELHAADPNGCIPKLAQLRSASFECADSAIVGVGCSSAFYEGSLCLDAHGRSLRGAEHVTLIDTDAVALAEAQRALDAPLARSLAVHEGAAEHFVWSRTFDLAVFLSLYHHYDRLGEAARTVGDGILHAIGAHCQAMVFETGQTDDTVEGASIWRDRLAMQHAASPRDWIEQHIPAVTGYTRWQWLGTNPVTQRHLMLFWHAGPTIDLARTFSRRAWHPGTAWRDGDGSTLWEIPSTEAREVRAIVRDGARPGAFPAGQAILVHTLADVRAVARVVPTAFMVRPAPDSETEHALCSAAYAGAVGYVAPQGWTASAALTRTLQRIGMRPLRTAAAPHP